MFEKLTYSVTFPSTGRTFAGDVNFSKGFGTITGPNEAGKSLIIEIARWCLFGAAALRGKADDYKTLKASLCFRVRGNPYEVERTQNSAKLFVHDVSDVGPMVLATGTKPVNAHICQLLGFGLEVFDVACAANQGDVEKLSSMKPTERKRMVDEVVGLNRLEDLAKWCGDEAKSIERSIVPPGDEPVAPNTRSLGKDMSEDMTEAVIEASLSRARAAYEELHQLNGVLSVAVAPPTPPICTVTEAAPDLRQVVEHEQTVRAELNMLQKRLAALPLASRYSEEELDTHSRIISDYTRWRMREQFEKFHPRSTYHYEQLRVMRDDWALVGQRDSLARLAAELRDHGEVDCPNCQHHFYLESGRLDELEQKLAGLRSIQRPLLSLAEINTEMGKLEDWLLKTTQDEWEQVKDAVQTAAPLHNLADIANFHRANAAALERSEIEQQISNIGVVEDHSGQLRERERYEEAIIRFHEDSAWYERRMVEQAQAQARVDEIAPLAAQFPILGQLQRDWSLYTERKAQWDCAKASFDKLTIEADGWRRAQTALNNLRAMVKGHLVPALSKVASHLLTQMTGGQRNVVSVDADFDVMVDGQALDTLSGSGKAVANLALRLGLGQVLTNNVLSVFVGDEIDASMDDTRAGNLGECIRTLSSKISQIVLITHKSHGDADWCVNLGNGE